MQTDLKKWQFPEPATTRVQTKVLCSNLLKNSHSSLFATALQLSESRVFDGYFTTVDRELISMKMAIETNALSVASYGLSRENQPEVASLL